jgi:hypothetical protein
MSELISSSFEVREPILRDELRAILKIENDHSFSQYVSVLLKVGLIKLFQNGIYYRPESDSRFSKLEPSLMDVIEKKYCADYKGFRIGSALLNQYKFTSQVSSNYEILSSNVSKNSRSVKVFDGKASVSSSKLPLNKNNYYYVVFAELLKNIEYSDYEEEENLVLLRKTFSDFKLNKREMLKTLEYYKGNRLQYMHILFEKV